MLSAYLVYRWMRREERRAADTIAKAQAAIAAARERATAAENAVLKARLDAAETKIVILESEISRLKRRRRRRLRVAALER